MKRAASVLAAALLVACRERGHGPSPAGSTSTVVAAPTITVVSPTASASAPAPTAAPRPPDDPAERFLLSAPIASIVAAHRPLARRGAFDAVLAAPDGRRAATLEIAVTADPVAYRHPLAFYRLARALGMRVVPVTVLRHVPAGDLATAAEASPEASAILRDARVLNDGTVDALLAAPARPYAGAPWEPLRASPIEPEHARETAACERWARSPDPAPGEDAGLLRDCVEMWVLDYLAANVARRQALVCAGERRAIVLADNATAFPPRPAPSVLDRMLRRLRAVERFPRGLRDALLAFDRERAAAVLADGGFADWLVTPRVRVEIDERRAALITLLEAKIAARSAEAVLVL